MIHPHTELRLCSPEVGQSVVATAPLPRGTIVWVRDPLDACWPVAEVMGWPEAYRPLLYRTCFVIGSVVVQPWDHARNMNHSCDASCAGTEFGFEVAVRDIGPGEPLTNDYTGFGLPGEPPFLCRCGAPACRGRDVFEAPAAVRQRLSEKFATALHDLPRTPQPLAELLQPGQIERALATAHL
jgi:uncharacterized protein